MSQELATWTVKRRLGRTKKTTQGSSCKIPGSPLRSPPVFLTVTPGKTRISILNTQVLDPRNTFPY